METKADIFMRSGVIKDTTDMFGRENTVDYLTGTDPLITKIPNDSLKVSIYFRADNKHNEAIIQGHSYVDFFSDMGGFA